MSRADSVTEVAKPVAPKEEFVYVTIPATDIYDLPYPAIQVIGGQTKKEPIEGFNLRFEPGHTYKMDAEMGAEVEARMAMCNKEAVRLLRPKADVKSLNQVNKGSQWQTNAFGAENGIPGLTSNEKVIEVRR